MLKACLSALRDGISVPYEVLIANNGEDEIRDLCDVYNEVSYIINNTSNKGFGVAHNQLAPKAQAKTLLLLNPDIIEMSMADSTISLSKQKKNGIIAPEVKNTEGEVEAWSRGSLLTPLSLVMRNIIPRKQKLLKKKKKYAMVTGAAMMIRKKVFIDIGGFDEKFFLYFEDCDFCRRVNSAGYDVIVDPASHVTHIAGASSDSKITQKEHYKKSQEYYFKKYYGNLTAKIIISIRKHTHTERNALSTTHKNIL